MKPATIQENVPLAPMTTIGVGGPAKYFLRTNEAGLHEALAWAHGQKQGVFILGGGSNVVFSDQGFQGLVIQLEAGGASYQDMGDSWIVEASGGDNWDELVAQTVVKNLAGLACLSGIPGKVGAAPIQNVGAYGVEIADSMLDLRAWDKETGEVVTFTNSQCGFGYRQSIFKGQLRGRHIVLSVRFKLLKNAAATAAYPELKRRLPAGAPPQQLRDTVLAIRREKSMVSDPADMNSRSCGSFFMNPLLDAAGYAQFLAREPGDHPAYSLENGGVKLPAAWLIEQSGFGKGHVQGTAGLSQKHCLAIINRGHSSALAIRALAANIQKAVTARFGVTLHPEPSILDPMGAVIPLGSG